VRFERLVGRLARHANAWDREVMGLGGPARGQSTKPLEDSLEQGVQAGAEDGGRQNLEGKVGPGASGAVGRVLGLAARFVPDAKAASVRDAGV
jgi:hypothetical protein